MNTNSSLPGPAIQAARSAVQAALAEHPEADAHSITKDTKAGDEGSLEPGEIQEVDMQAQAETIRTVFSDPRNFNVKVNSSPFIFSLISKPFFFSAS
jgi:translation initiation factor 4E